CLVAACPTSEPAPLAPSGDDAGSDTGAPPPSDDAEPAEATASDAAKADAADEEAATSDAAAPEVADGATESGVDVADAGRTVLCVRLFDPTKPNAVTVLAEQVDKDYVTRVYRDCTVAKIARTELDT